MTATGETRADRNRRNRAKRFAARVEIDGRLVAVNAREHGTVSTRSNHGCECDPCRSAARGFNTPYRRERRRVDPDFRARANEATRRYMERKRRQAGEAT